ncbi:hypothetical protein SAMN05444389_101412 [Paracoccus solventivorans]|uniref:Uncharacterized protein n=2 Tax=Paracoccus solventivorans TaxID=53463 RepID=A0A1M7DLD3_9RHOB|nr:hypothetical protein SAMN05444389_101412 [Paracoccus solventivorans]
MLQQFLDLRPAGGFGLIMADRLRVAAAVGGHLTFQGDPDDLRRLARAIDYCNTAWAAAESHAQSRAAKRLERDLDRARKLAAWRDVLMCMAAQVAADLALAALCGS